MNEPFYSSSRGLTPYQLEGVLKWVKTRGILCTWEPGTGKSHLALAGGSLLLESGQVGLVLVLCESNKVQEWLEDFESFTLARAKIYKGSPASHEKIRGSVGEPGGPQVLISTYETARNDLGKFAKVDGRKQWVTGPLHEMLVSVASSDGVAVVADESTKLGNRYQGGHRRGGVWVGPSGSLVYKGVESTFAEIRRINPEKLWVAGLSGTPIETSVDNAFNQLRLIAPEVAGSLAAYEKDYVQYRPAFGAARYQNLSPDYLWTTPGVVPFSEKISPVLSHKRKDDPDVRAEFPSAIEEPVYVDLHPDHKALYQAVKGLSGDPEVFPAGMSKRDEDVLFGILRQVAAHPMALALSAASQEDGTLANLIVERVGVEVLRSIPSYKERELVRLLEGLVASGSQVVVFTFFAGVIPLLEDSIRAAGISVASYSGRLSQAERERNKMAFKRGEVSVLVCSDAGARGMNLPEAQYGINFELCLTDAKTKQRVSRYNRLDSAFDTVTSFSLVAVDTVEEAVVALNLRRHELHHAVLGGERDRSESILGEDGEAESEFLPSLTPEARRELFKNRREIVSA